MYPDIYKEYAPNKHLRQFIKCYWQFEKTYAEGEFEHVFPDSSYELIYGPGVTYIVDDVSVPELYMVGQLKKPVDFFAVGTVRHWAIRFYPWGLQPFVHVAQLSRDSWLPATDILKAQDCQELKMAIHDSQTTEEVIAALDDYFITRLLSAQFEDAALRRIIVDLKAKKGAVKVKDLADACYISQRHLSRKITRATGQSPHAVASRLRFEHVRDAIMHNPDIPLTFLATEHGYTDQAHLVKEFRAYTDTTPTAYADFFRSVRPQMQNQQNVLFLQAEEHKRSLP